MVIQWNVISHEENKVLILVTTWMNLENIVLNERNKSQKMTVYYSIYMKCQEQGNL